MLICWPATLSTAWHLPRLLYFPLGSPIVPWRSQVPQEEHAQLRNTMVYSTYLYIRGEQPVNLVALGQASVLSPCPSTLQGWASCASQIASVYPHIDISCAAQGQGRGTSVRRLWPPALRLHSTGTYRHARARQGGREASPCCAACGYTPSTSSQLYLVPPNPRNHLCNIQNPRQIAPSSLPKLCPLV